MNTTNKMLHKQKDDYYFTSTKKVAPFTYIYGEGSKKDSKIIF